MENNQFNYSYKAPTAEERREIVSIRRQYEEREETKLEKLRRLDARVKKPAVTLSVMLGIAGCLLFGLGLTCVLEWNAWAAGTLLGILGFVPMIAAYPIYRNILKRNKKKYGIEILTLTEELLNELPKSERNGREPD